MLEDIQRIAAYYDRLVERYGYDPRGVDASSQASLDVRYRALSEVVDLSNRTVLEVGCGFGDLGAFICNRYAGVKYTGIDISPRVLERAKQIHPNLRFERISLQEFDDTQRFDVVVAQGIFYLLGDAAEEKAVALIKKMFALATVAVAFSTISAWSDRRDGGEYYADPANVLQQCSLLTRNVVLRHDYHPGDFCIYLYR